MNRLIRYFLSFFFCLAASAAPLVQAHQQKAAISTILFNSRTGNIEIAHRFYLHDAEHAIKGILNGKADLMKDKAVQKAFAEYVVEHFSLVLNQEIALSLKPLGQEVDGKFFWVYQEVSTLIETQQLEVTYDALMEVWPSQRNIVNIEGLGTLRSVELTASNTSKEITL